MGGCPRVFSRSGVRLICAIALWVLAVPAQADSAMCNFPRNAWLNAVSSGDAGRIAAARQRAIAARHNCPELYAQVLAWKPPAKDRPRTDEPPPPRRTEPPPRRELPNPIGTHFRLVSRLAKDSPLPQLFDGQRGWWLSLVDGQIVKYALATGTALPAARSPMTITRIGAYNQVAGTFYAIAKDGMVGYCTAATLACTWPKNNGGVIAAAFEPSSSPGFDTLAIGRNTKGQATVTAFKTGKGLGTVAMAPFNRQAQSGDGRYFCTIPTNPGPPRELHCFDLAKRKPTGRISIGGFIENPVADRTRWDESDATRQSNFDAAGNRMAVYSDGQLRIFTGANLSKSQVFRLSDLVVTPSTGNYAIRLIDKGARLIFWDPRERFDTELFSFTVIDLDTQLAANRLRRFELKFPVRKAAAADAPLAINAFHLGGDSFLFEAPFAPAQLFSARDGKMTPLAAPPGERAEAYYASFLAPEENLLFAKYSAIGNWHAMELVPGMRQLGRPGSVGVWRLPGPGGYYFFHSLIEGANEWQSEIRHYVPGN